jgi:putative ABC transport system permease protein
MSAVWRAARAAVRRRRLQTFVIGLVVLLSTASIVVALALLDASSAPFDRAFAEQRGAHVVATYDAAAVTGARLAEHRPGVTAVAGPYRQAAVDTARDGNPPQLQGRPLTIVGRADPGGDPVDAVRLWHGRWATGPGEIVLDEAPPAAGFQPRFRPEDGRLTLADGRTFTVVGRAHSLSRTADAWVTPDTIDALHPTTIQMLYRFADAGTAAKVDAHVAALRSGLPPNALVAAQSYLVVKEAVAAGPGAYVPFLVVFGVLGLIVAVLIVGNVVSGAVVSGYRHIGVLKAMGFTPRQVVAVYLTMVSVPAVAGCALGTVLGDVGARPLLRSAFLGLGFGSDVGVAAWIDVAALVGAPAVVLLAALVPALRAYRLSAAEAISAGSAPRPGRALRVQRALGGTRLPRAVSLGLGLPFARPGRTALTMAAVVLGVVTVTFATGMSDTVRRYSDLVDLKDAPIAVRPRADDGRSVTQRSVPEVEQLLHAVPGTTRVAAGLDLEVSIVGDRQPATVFFLHGDVAAMGFQNQIVAGHWLRGPDEVVAPSTVLHDHGLSVGDRVTVRLGGRQRTVTVVGEIMASSPGRPRLVAGWDTFERLAPDYRVLPQEVYYAIAVAPGTDTGRYLAAVRAADPGLDAWDNSGANDYTTAVVALSTVLTLLLGLVAALGVFNTVVLDTHDRRRDLGMLKSIGMTPRQVVVMMVTSMAALGVVGGLLGVPLGILAHRVVVPITADAANVSLARALLEVWRPGGLVLLAAAGLAITVLGALVPARSAARLTIAEVLHNE